VGVRTRAFMSPRDPLFGRDMTESPNRFLGLTMYLLG
jgi:hypothetical protein